MKDKELYLLKFATASGFDADAQTYLTAVEATGASLSATQKGAVNTLVEALKTAALWSHFVALYPFVGGTAAAHSINAKSPGTYNIVWNGTVAHNANGIAGDGATGYGALGLTAYALSQLNSRSASFGCYRRSAGNNYQQDLGERIGSNPYQGYYYDSYEDNFSGNAGATDSTKVGDALGSAHTRLLAISRLTGDTKIRGYYRGAQSSESTGIDTPDLTGLTNGMILLGIHNGAALSLTNVNLAFAFVSSEGLTSSQASALAAAVDAFQTTLARNV